MSTPLDFKVSDNDVHRSLHPDRTLGKQLHREQVISLIHMQIVKFDRDIQICFIFEAIGFIFAIRGAILT